MENRTERAGGQPAKKSRANIIAPAILIAVFLLLEAVGGGILYYAHAKERVCSAVTEGRLIEWETRKKKNSAFYVPIVEYKAGDEIYLGVSNTSSGRRTIKEGDTVVIGYNPSNPYEFYIEGHDLRRMRSFGGIFIMIGALLALLQALCAVFNRMDMEEKKRTRVNEILWALGVFAVFYRIMAFALGIGVATLLTVIMGFLFLLASRKKKHKNQDV